MRRALVTGANGFVGSALCERLVQDGWTVRGAVRERPERDTRPSTFPPLQRGDRGDLLLARNPETPVPPGGAETVTVGLLGGDTEWGDAVKGVQTVVHLAARVHVLREDSSDPLSEFRKANVEGTARLAREAAAAGVRRFIFLSTIGVHGNRTLPGAPFRENDPASPHNDYSLSKWEAEEELRRLSREVAMETVIVRAPLVYGPAAPGNFRTLLDLVHRKVPLPLGAVRNERSFLYLQNLVAALALCAEHPAAAGKTYLVSDDDATSTVALVQTLAAALRTSPRIFPVPVPLLRVTGEILGKGSAVAGLVDSLTVDSSAIRSDLGWCPPCTMEEGVRETAAWYLGHARRTS
ncbi:NAD-dependent epimerase/dehydratase family protein [Geomonas sp. RF6]|uniref:NAD-dependent epimerase/dehydratase family protein n=1 Tax=Geomonas sp. RF6 TaxID=2897342 RepID=UPI001E2F3BCB|nr:NAD-dependent epimerase/dehydratase family protein [Geomonas sp. RF6]UFS71301.1 NAD-dependent epimerase/dehydratase family protein [Geomonas sp. RF6]